MGINILHLKSRRLSFIYSYMSSYPHKQFDNKATKVDDENITKGGDQYEHSKRHQGQLVGLGLRGCGNTNIWCGGGLLAGANTTSITLFIQRLRAD
jgi:hypothetical protein